MRTGILTAEGARRMGRPEASGKKVTFTVSPIKPSHTREIFIRDDVSHIVSLPIGTADGIVEVSASPTYEPTELMTDIWYGDVAIDGGYYFHGFYVLADNACDAERKILALFRRRHPKYATTKASVYYFHGPSGQNDGPHRVAVGLIP